MTESISIDDSPVVSTEGKSEFGTYHVQNMNQSATSTFIHTLQTSQLNYIVILVARCSNP